MNWLTRQEQYVLTMALALLLVGLAVKTYRTTHPSETGEGAIQSGTANTAAPANEP
jgi:hypothetical protein